MKHQRPSACPRKCPPPPEPREVSGPEQIACIEREINLRQLVYPKLIASKKMSREFAKQQIEAMQAALETVRQAYPAPPPEPPEHPELFVSPEDDCPY